MSGPSDTPARSSSYDYGGVAFCYDELAALYSFGRIARSKRAFLAHVRAGDSVLVVGAGRGDDALEAARRGARVTAIDRSGAMLERLRTAAERDDLAVACVESRFETATLEEPFDHVVAHYFLNCFAEEEARRLLAALSRRVAAGGCLHLADFAPARGGRFARGLSALYYRAVNLAGWAMGLCALHEIPDLRLWLEDVGFAVEDVGRFPIGPGPAPAYWAVTGRAPTNSGDPSHRGPVGSADPPSGAPGFA